MLFDIATKYIINVPIFSTPTRCERQNRSIKKAAFKIVEIANENDKHMLQ